MLLELSLGGALIVVSAIMHVAALDLIATRVRKVIGRHSLPLGVWTRMSLLTFTTLATFISHALQIWVWAMVYLAIGELDGLEPALYFSTVVFTTLGFGDILASVGWRLMAACEGAAGMLLFGLSTAFLFEMLREIMRQQR